MHAAAVFLVIAPSLCFVVGGRGVPSAATADVTVAPLPVGAAMLAPLVRGGRWSLPGLVMLVCSLCFVCSSAALVATSDPVSVMLVFLLCILLAAS